MASSLHTYLAAATQAASEGLVSALDQMPAERRGWQPIESARSALDQFAECAILNGNTADLIRQRAGKPLSYGEEYAQLKEALVREESAARGLLTENTARVIAEIMGIPDSEWDDRILLPWGSMSLRELAAFPCWNMVYHTGQIYYAASLL